MAFNNGVRTSHYVHVLRFYSPVQFSSVSFFFDHYIQSLVQCRRFSVALPGMLRRWKGRTGSRASVWLGGCCCAVSQANYPGNAAAQKLAGLWKPLELGKGGATDNTDDADEAALHGRASLEQRPFSRRQ